MTSTVIFALGSSLTAFAEGEKNWNVAIASLEINESKQSTRTMELKDGKFVVVENSVCCRYHDQGKWHYKRLTTQACNVAVGDVVDDSNCD
ncbi:MAG: hypothetical protein AAF478_11470 [Pseudomonadota bacterium]